MTSGPPITAHLGGYLEVRDGSVVDGEAALLLVELQQPVHAAVLLELVRLRQHKHHPQLVNLDTGLVLPTGVYILFENSYTFHNFSLNLPLFQKNFALRAACADWWIFFHFRELGGEER